MGPLRWISTTALVGSLAGALILAPAAVRAQDTITPIAPSQAALPTQAAPPPAAPVFDQAQLQSMLAPIALYPDQLLGQVLMAAAYPDEVAAADQWVHDPANAGLSGDALNAALAPIDWDPSVKSLVPFPQVLDTMAQHMDWTQQLGQAFVVQQADVMNAVQTLRREAEAHGNLRPTPQLAVAQAGGVITIEPANPEMLYVPIYDPVVVYGAWPYPVAPVVIYPPRVYAAPIIFSVGFVIVRPLWGWSRCDWVHRDVFVEPARVNVINARLIEEHHRERVADSHWQFDRSRDRDHDWSHGRARDVGPHDVGPHDVGRGGRPEPAHAAAVAPRPAEARPGLSHAESSHAAPSHAAPLHAGPSHPMPAAVRPQQPAPQRRQWQDQRHAPQAAQRQWHAPAAQAAPHAVPHGQPPHGPGPAIAAAPHAPQSAPHPMPQAHPQASRPEPHPQAAPAHTEAPHADHGRDDRH